MTDCTFCAIIAGQVPAYIVRRWNNATAFKPLDPVNAGHTLIVPNTHVPMFGTNPAASALAAHRAAEYVGELAEQGIDSNLIVNAGRNAGQTVDHLHFHVIPREPEDGLLFPWSHQEKTRCGHPRGEHGQRGCRVGLTSRTPCPCRYAANDLHRDVC